MKLMNHSATSMLPMTLAPSSVSNETQSIDIIPEKKYKEVCSGYKSCLIGGTLTSEKAHVRVSTTLIASRQLSWIMGHKWVMVPRCMHDISYVELMMEVGDGA